MHAGLRDLLRLLRRTLTCLRQAHRLSRSFEDLSRASPLLSLLTLYLRSHLMYSLGLIVIISTIWLL